ncbi:hypothetical protein B0H17DRAFT_1125605 [Mycena rosella]|uniref:Uncharacterized protein n=1 Tax=Mycena rosella TaxID=1033263 RepID=A0AAD7GWU4_MYCRO|nr:hypothetical protein B0H17DRAFT_1125605 [Mycena rosella]
MRRPDEMGDTGSLSRSISNREMKWLAKNSHVCVAHEEDRISEGLGSGHDSHLLGNRHANEVALEHEPAQEDVQERHDRSCAGSAAAIILEMRRRTEPNLFCMPVSRDILEFAGECTRFPPVIFKSTSSSLPSMGICAKNDPALGAVTALSACDGLSLTELIFTADTEPSISALGAGVSSELSGVGQGYGKRNDAMGWEPLCGGAGYSDAEHLQRTCKQASVFPRLGASGGTAGSLPFHCGIRTLTQLKNRTADEVDQYNILLAEIRALSARISTGGPKIARIRLNIAKLPQERASELMAGPPRRKNQNYPSPMSKFVEFWGVSRQIPAQMSGLLPGPLPRSRIDTKPSHLLSPVLARRHGAHTFG